MRRKRDARARSRHRDARTLATVRL